MLSVTGFQEPLVRDCPGGYVGLQEGVRYGVHGEGYLKNSVRDSDMLPSPRPRRTRSGVGSGTDNRHRAEAMAVSRRFH